MHAALHIPELLDNIFLQVSAYNDPVFQATLLSAARACTTWNQSSIPLLWRQLDNLEPLIELLGKLEMVGSERSSSLAKWDLADYLISNHAWVRFDLHASYVQEISVTVGVEKVFKPAVYKALFQHCAETSAILPNLRVLSFSDYTHKKSSSMTLLFHLLSAPLRSLILFVWEKAGITTNSFAKDVSQCVPNLEHLSISADHEEWSAKNVEKCFKGFPKLKKLELWTENITSALVKNLSELETLEHVYISGHGRHYDPLYPSIPPFKPDGFNSLTTLDLSATLTAWANLFESGSVPATLKSVTLNSGSNVQSTPESPSTVHRLCSAIAQAVPAIEDINLETYWTGSDAEAITYEHIEPLTRCQAIKTLAISNLAGVAIAPEQLGVLLDAWPKLRELEIGCSTHRPGWPSDAAEVDISWPTPGMSLDILKLFAEKCPKIERLGLYLNSMQPSPAEVDTLPPLRELCILEVYGSSMDNPLEAIEYLARRTSARLALRWDAGDSISEALQKRLDAGSSEGVTALFGWQMVDSGLKMRHRSEAAGGATTPGWHSTE